MREISSLAEASHLVGQELAVTDWHDISQTRVNQFAEATGDHQWIHTDVERSRRESPFGGTIAHGFLTLSLLPMMLEQAIVIRDVRMAVNYGLNKARFPAPVPVGSRLRGRITLAAMETIAGGAQLQWNMLVECDGSDKPVCVAEVIVRCYTGHAGTA
jgi:acyl dehydratase